MQPSIMPYLTRRSSGATSSASAMLIRPRSRDPRGPRETTERRSHLRNSMERAGRTSASSGEYPIYLPVSSHAVHRPCRPGQNA